MFPRLSTLSHPSLLAAVLSTAVLLLFPRAASAQSASGKDFEVKSIVPDVVTTPDFSVSYGPKNKKVAKNKDWLEVEVTFDWLPRAAEPKFLDDLTLNYYVLLNNAGKEYPRGTLLTGSVTLTAVPQGKGMHAVMYISPRALERFFDGKAPGTAAAAVKDAGVDVTSKGQSQANLSWKGKGEWWRKEGEPTPGYLLNKNETPFAPLAWDYYEAIKSRPAGY